MFLKGFRYNVIESKLLGFLMSVYAASISFNRGLARKREVVLTGIHLSGTLMKNRLPDGIPEK